MGWDALGKTLNNFVEERLVSPLLGTFAISWCIWNYRFLVILFSDANVTTTFALIETVAFPDHWAILFRGFIFPLATTLVYLYAYPYPASWVLEQWKKTQLLLSTIRRKYDDETPASQAELRAERLARYAAEEEAEKLRGNLAQVRRDYSEAMRAADSARSAKPLDAVLTIEKTTEVADESEHEGAPPEKVNLSGLPRLTELQIATMNFLDSRNGQASEMAIFDILAKNADISRVHAQYIIDELLDATLIETFFVDGVKHFKLTRQGRRLLYSDKES